MSANIEQIKAMLERAGKTNLLQKQTVGLDKERTQLEAAVNIEKIDKNLEEAAEEYSKKVSDGHNYRDLTCGFIAGAKWQKAQMPAEWSKNDTVFLNEITDFFENKTVRLQHDIDMYAHWLKSLPERFNLQPKQEWSEEDEQLIGFIFDLLNGLVWRNDWAMSKEECLERLKSLRPSWRPSEWQMSMLLAVINDPNNAGTESCQLALKSLYEQLKKLM